MAYLSSFKLTVWNGRKRTQIIFFSSELCLDDICQVMIHSRWKIIWCWSLQSSSNNFPEFVMRKWHSYSWTLPLYSQYSHYSIHPYHIPIIHGISLAEKYWCMHLSSICTQNINTQVCVYILIAHEYKQNAWNHRFSYFSTLGNNQWWTMETNLREAFVNHWQMKSLLAVPGKTTQQKLNCSSECDHTVMLPRQHTVPLRFIITVHA